MGLVVVDFGVDIYRIVRRNANLTDVVDVLAEFDNYCKICLALLVALGLPAGMASAGCAGSCGSTGRTMIHRPHLADTSLVIIRHEAS